MLPPPLSFFFFFFNDTATTEIYTLSLHDALPICAIPRTPPGHGARQTLETEIRDAVGVEILPDFFERMGGRNQLGPPGRIDAVEARRDGWWTADPHMHLAGARAANHAHDLAAGCTAHDRIVHEHNALAFEDTPDGIQFHPDAEVADRLLRLDERPPDIMISNQAHAHRHAALFGEADGGTHARIGNRHDDVGIHRSFPGKPPSEVGSDFIDAFAEDIAVGPREIDVLEDAL